MLNVFVSPFSIHAASPASSCLVLFHTFHPPPPPFHISHFLSDAMHASAERVWPRAVLLTQHFFPPPHSLPLCSLPLPPLSLSSPPFLPLSRLRSLQPVNFQTSPPPKCSYSLPPPFLSPSIFLISFQIFALQCPYSSSAPSCPAKIRRCGCPGLLTLYYWAERAALQKLTIHIIPTAWGGGLHFLLCVTTVLASPVLAHVQRIHGQYFLKGTGF